MSASSLIGTLRRHWQSHGTLKAPGPDLGRMPIGLDLAGISFAEGLRAAVGTGLVLLANIWIGSPALTVVAFAALLTCFCDTGGPVGHRVPALLTFSVCGGVIWAVFGLVHDVGWLLLVPLSGLVVFCNSMTRVWGMRAQAVGNVLTVVLALAVDRPLSPAHALGVLVAFLIGGAWATLLTIGIWRIHPHRPAMRMVAENWRGLAALTRDLADLTAADEGDPARWEAHARGHRRAMRDGLEASRTLLMVSVRSPGPISPESARGLLGFETAEQVFGGLIALSDLLESTRDPALRATALKVLRRLRPVLVLLGQDLGGVSDRVEASLDRMLADGEEAPALAGIVRMLVDRLRLAFGLKRDQGRPETPWGGEARPSWLTVSLQQLRAGLTWESAVLRHAVRATVLTMAAVGVTLAWWTPYAHWLTITVALTMQPYFAATWQRALERVGGTVLGALIGAGLAFVPPSALNHAILLIPLCILGFSVRQVSYGAYIACLTPLTVLLFEVAEPGHSEWVVAAWRTFYTIGGGGLAVLACMVLWPSWEPDRTAGEIRRALQAHADYARAVFDLASGDGPPDRLDDARRRAGVASNNLEASLSRALQEPRRRRSHQLETLLAADAALRRLGGGFVALSFDPQARTGLGEGAWEAWRRWIPYALTALADQRRAISPRPAAPPHSTLDRLGRGIELLVKLLSQESVPGVGPESGG